MKKRICIFVCCILTVVLLGGGCGSKKQEDVVFECPGVPEPMQPGSQVEFITDTTIRMIAGGFPNEGKESILKDGRSQEIKLSLPEEYYCAIWPTVYYKPVKGVTITYGEDGMILEIKYPEGVANPYEDTAEAVKENLSGMAEWLSSKNASVSSNPYDYTDNKYFAELVHAGPGALASMESALTASSDDGVYTYLIAIAMEEISRTDIRMIRKDELAWSTGKEYLQVWQEVKGKAADDIRKILEDGERKDTDKLDEIKAYGMLAIPTINRALADQGLDWRLREGLEALRSEFSLRENDYVTLENYLAVKK